jgi:plasmid stabilization system protein ParE
MADYVLSNKADADLDDIYVYSYRTFGEAMDAPRHLKPE